MPELPKPADVPPHAPFRRAQEPDKVLCECGTEMYRMHAVWRCPTCGYQTDCCGW